MSSVAYRDSKNRSLAYCPYCGNFHRVKKSSNIMSHIKCPKSGQMYRVADLVIERRK